MDTINWTTVLVAFIGSIPAGIMAGIALYQALKVHGLINSRMSELLKVTKEAATAEATIAEKAAETDRKVAVAEAIVVAKGNIE